MWGKIARWLLPISLAANLFFIVVAIRYHVFMRPQPPGPHEVVGFLKNNLSPEDAAIVQQSFAAHTGALQELERGNHTFQDRISAALNADPFDPKALSEVFAEARATHQAMEDNMAAAFVDAASKISPEGRAKLAAQRGRGAAFLRRRMERRGGPGGPAGPGGPPPTPGDTPPPR